LRLVVGAEATIFTTWLKLFAVLLPLSPLNSLCS
jgi:hypothetical protein